MTTWSIDVNMLAVIVSRAGGKIDITQADLAAVVPGSQLKHEVSPDRQSLRLEVVPAAIDAEFKVIR